jgi:hypothetical protein
MHRDIGKMVEVSRDGNVWQSGNLLLMSYGRRGTYYTIDMNQSPFEHARVEYDTTDPAAQLAVAADALSDAGMELAAEVLRVASTMDGETLQKLLTYGEGDTISVWHTLLNELRRR